MRIDYSGTGSFKGIDGYRFSIDNNTLYSATKNPENDCYCTKSMSDPTGTPSCFLDGIIDVSPCFSKYIKCSY